MVIKFNIKNQKIICDKTIVVEKSKNYLTGKFDFQTPDWDGCEKTAYFKNKNTGVEDSRLLVDDECHIPTSVTNSPGYIEVSVHGVKDDTVITSGVCEFLATRTMSNENNIPDDDLTLYEQLLSEIGNKVPNNGWQPDMYLGTDENGNVVEKEAPEGTGGNPQKGEDGGYYTPSVTQTSEDTVNFAFTPSKNNMNAVSPVSIKLPRGEDGVDGTNGTNGKDGEDGVGIQSVEQTTTSTEDNGENVVTVTLTNGQKSTFTVRNGSQGNPGTGGGGDIDLSGYATKEEVDTKLKTKANAIITEKSGSTIVATDSSEDAPEGLNVYGKSTQETTQGNQLCNLPDFTATRHGITWECKKGIVKAVGTATELAASRSYGLVCNPPILAGTYFVSGSKNEVKVYARIKKADGTITYHSENTFTLDGTEAEFEIYMQINSGKTVNETVYPMLNAGNTALPWEPYTNGASPNPEYPQLIESCENTEVGVYGGNLCIENLKAYITEETRVVCVDNNSETFVFYANKGVTYSFGSDTAGNRTVIGYSDVTPADKVPLYDVEKLSEKTTFTAKHNAYVAIYYNSSRNDEIAKTFRVNAGETLLPYEPYKEPQSLTIPYTLCGIHVTDASIANYTDDNGQMWVCDEVDLERGKYVQRVVKCTPNIYWNSVTHHQTDLTAENGFVSLRIAKSEIPEVSSVHTSVKSVLMSNMFREIGYWGLAKEHMSYVDGLMITTHYSNIGLSEWTNDSAKIRTAFRQSNMYNELYIYALLATPIETDLTPEEIAAYKALTMNYPTTTILNNNGAGMKVSYVADTQNHIEQNYVPVTEFNALVNRVIALEQNAV